VSVPNPDPRAPGSEHAILTRGVTRAFAHKIALHPFDLQLAAGGITGLLGPNGSGKSTLLRILTGLVRPDAGSARVAGVELSGDGTAIRARASYMPGEIALYTELSGDEHLAWFVRGRERAALPRARELARGFELPLERKVRTYSHGMKRLLMFAAALAPDVPVRILDEPTDGLDPSKRGALLELLRADVARGTTILLSSHHLGEVDLACDRLVFVNAGKKIAEESASSLEQRARRLVRLTFDAGTDMARVERMLGRVLPQKVELDGLRARVTLAHDDPRPLLGGISIMPDFPRPRGIEYGQLSLAELYRDLYGVEGV